MMFVMTESTPVGVQAVDPTIPGADPECFRRVFIDTIHRAAAEAVGTPGLVPVGSKAIVPPVKPVETAFKSADPDDPGMVFMNAANFIMAQTPRISRFMLISLKTMIFPIEAVQAVHRTNPEKTMPVLVNGGDVAVTQTVWVVGIFPVSFKRAAAAIGMVHAIRPDADP